MGGLERRSYPDSDDFHDLLSMKKKNQKLAQLNKNYVMQLVIFLISIVMIVFS